MAKEYQAPKKSGGDDEDNERLKQHQQNNPQASSRVAGDKTADHSNDVNEYDERQMKEARAASDRAGKEQTAYINDLNKMIGAVVDKAAGYKESNPQYLNFAAEALKNAACQIEAATPQGSSHATQHAQPL
jgi:hypothetical protein